MSRSNLVSTTDGLLTRADILDADQLVGQQSSLHRREATANAGLTSGRVYFAYFTAKATATYNNIRAINATAASATPTLIRMGIYSVDGSGNLTLIAASASDTTLFATTFTAYTKALTAPATLTRGSRYAAALLVVSGAGMPSIYCSQTMVATELAQNPALATYLGSQSDLPNSAAVGTLTNNGFSLYEVLS